MLSRQRREMLEGLDSRQAGTVQNLQEDHYGRVQKASGGPGLYV